MKNRFLAIIVGSTIAASVIFAVSFEPLFKEEYYDIKIVGMNDVYLVGEPYSFSYVLSGYGSSCGSKNVFFIDKDGNGIEEFSRALCDADIPMRDFMFDLHEEQGKTYGNVGIIVPGRYTVVVTLNYTPVQDAHQFVVVEKNCDNMINDMTKAQCFAESYESCESAYMTQQFTSKEDNGNVLLVATVESWNDCKIIVHTENSRGGHSQFNGIVSSCDDISVNEDSLIFERCNNADYPPIIFAEKESKSQFPSRIPLPSGEFDENLENVILWNIVNELKRNEITYWQNDPSIGTNYADGWSNPSNLCSRIFLDDMADPLYVSASFYSEPELDITEITIDKSNPVDCQKWFHIPNVIEFKNEEVAHIFNFDK